MKTATLPKKSRRIILPHSGRMKTRQHALRVQRILAPVDFSQSSMAALEEAIALSKYFGAELHLIHVYEPEHSFIESSALPILLPAHNVREKLQRHLRKVANDRGIESNHGHLHTLEGSPFEQICSAAANLKIDLIVISTRGNTGLKHLVLGSTAERVVRNSPCPVLVLRPNNVGLWRNKNITGDSPALKTIVVPVDFSDCSMEGLTYAKKIAAEFGATLVLLHSVYLQYYVSSDEYARYDFPEVMRETEALAREHMEELVRALREEGFKIEPALEIGHAGQQICDRSDDRNADLIVTSTHGHTGLKHVMLGSTAEFVVRHAKCPVLVVPTRSRIDHRELK